MSVAGSDASSRPHIAARLDDQVTGLTNQLFRRRGWQPRIVPYTGYGSTEWIRILARVLLAPPRGAEPVDTETTVARQQTTRGWRRFLTTPIEDVEVEVDLGSRTHLLRTARGGVHRRGAARPARAGSGRVGSRFSYGQRIPDRPWSTSASSAATDSRGSSATSTTPWW